MSDNTVPQAPIDPFAGSAPVIEPAADGAVINAFHASNSQIGLALIADARNYFDTIIARIPDVRGNKCLGSLRSAFASIWHDLNRAEQYQKEIAAFLPPDSQE
jgi:hypothetical protein